MVLAPFQEERTASLFTGLPPNSDTRTLQSADPKGMSTKTTTTTITTTPATTAKGIFILRFTKLNYGGREGKIGNPTKFVFFLNIGNVL